MCRLRAVGIAAALKEVLSDNEHRTQHRVQLISFENSSGANDATIARLEKEVEDLNQVCGAMLQGLRECAPGRKRSQQHRRCLLFRPLLALLLSRRGQHLEVGITDSEMVVARAKQAERVQANVVVES